MSYVLFGKKVLNEHLALGVYGIVGLSTYFAMSGESKPKVATKEVVSNTSGDEAEFIANFIKNLEKEDVKH